MSEETVVAQKAKKTIQERRNDTAALLARYDAAIAAGLTELPGGAAAKKDVVAVNIGDEIEFYFGRADSKVVKRGTVRANVDGNLRVLSGEGVDMDIFKVLQVNVISNITASQAAAPSSDAGPLAEQ